MNNHYHHRMFGPSTLARQREKGSYQAAYPRRQRVKIYGRARAVDGREDPKLHERLKDLGSSTVAAASERSIIPRYDQAYVSRMSDLYVRDAAEREQALLDRIAELEAQLG